MLHFTCAATRCLEERIHGFPAPPLRVKRLCKATPSVDHSAGITPAPCCHRPSTKLGDGIILPQLDLLLIAAADRQLLVPLRLDDLDREIVDASRDWALTQEREQRLDVPLASLGVDERLLGALAVADPSEQAEIRGRGDGRLPQAYALHRTVDARADGMLGGSLIAAADYGVSRCDRRREAPARVNAVYKPDG